MLFRSGTSERDKREFLPPRKYMRPPLAWLTRSPRRGGLSTARGSLSVVRAWGVCRVPALAFAASGALSAEYFSICSRTPPRLSRGCAFSAAKGKRPRYAEHLRRFRSFAMICYCGGVPGGWGVPPGF